MKFDLPRAGGILVAVIVLGIGGLAISGVMTLQTVFMMVLPSMAIFAAVAFWLEMKRGEYRALSWDRLAKRTDVIADDYLNEFYDSV